MAVATTVIKKLFEAQSEAQKLIERVEANRTLNENFAILSEARRQQRGGLPKSNIEKHFAELFRESIDRCHESLQQLDKKLNSNSTLPEGGVRSRVNNSVRFVFGSDSIEKHERQVEKQSENVALSLNALHYIDSSADSAITHELLATILGLLEKRLNEPQLDSQKGIHSPQRHPIQNAEEHPRSEDAVDAASLTTARDTDGQRNARIEELKRLRLPKTPQEKAALVQPAETPIMIAVKNNEINDVTKLLRLDKDSSYQPDGNGWTVLHHAVQKNNIEMLQVLIIGGIARKEGFLDKPSNQKQTPLMLAAKAAGVEIAYYIAQTLIAAGCDLNVKDGQGRDALCHAMENTPDDYSEKFVELLVDRGADVMIVYGKFPKLVQKYHYVDKEVRRRRGEQDSGGEPLIRRLSRALSIGSKGDN